jgi:osmoprotectant transport system permease protein
MMARWMCLVIVFALVPRPGRGEPVTIGSKRFTESYVLGEIIRQKLADAGLAADHRQGMGGTIIVWGALTSGGIDLYPDYTGTVAQEILAGRTGTDPADLQRALLPAGVGMTASLGFNNTYALVVPQALAQALRLRRISDLRSHPSLRVGLTHEFIDRKDGWKPLAARYGLGMPDVRGLEHGLAYAALRRGEIDVTDAYSTDARIATDNLTVLEDDLSFFPRYDAIVLFRKALDPRVVAVLTSIEGTISESAMIRMNAEAERTGDYRRAARLYFSALSGRADPPDARARAGRIAGWTWRHIQLVGMSLILAIAVGVPLGIRASRPGWVSRIILGTTGVIYTIPSLALLALLVPLPYFGISTRTVIVALFLYSLLPIVRNTASGLEDIALPIRESAAALGLSERAQLTQVYLPMASRAILTGIKTSAVINVATATLAALIGAGGLGEPIFSGLSLNDHATILTGAIPVAVLAILVQAGFEVLDRLLIPKGLRLRAPESGQP